MREIKVPGHATTVIAHDYNTHDKFVVALADERDRYRLALEMISEGEEEGYPGSLATALQLRDMARKAINV